VTISWWPAKKIKRAKGIVATLYSAGLPRYARVDFPSNFPDWWDDFVAANSSGGQSWQKGHLLGSQFGGPPTAYNLAPQYEAVNLGPIQRCDNRIKDDLACGPVKYRIEVIYGQQRKLVPIAFYIVAKGWSLDLEATVNNVPSPTIPPLCEQ
jgi:hypothetical protein